MDAVGGGLVRRNAAANRSGLGSTRWLHDMRHTSASLLVAAGAPIKAVQSQLGHSSAKMTLNRYSHLYPDDLDALAGHLDAVRSRAELARRLSTPSPERGRGRAR